MKDDSNNEGLATQPAEEGDGQSCVRVEIDIDAEKHKAASTQEKQDFLTALFFAASNATSLYKAEVDFSDPLHWVITIPEQHEWSMRHMLKTGELPRYPDSGDWEWLK